MNYYHAFGLNIRSEIELPELVNAEFDEADVEICLGEVPESIDPVLAKGAAFRANETQFLLNVKDIARYYVENGSKAIVSIENASEVGMVKAFILGSTFGAILHQRNYLLIHGSAIDTDKGAVIFSGVSGAGKSTLAAAFEQRAYKMLSDDICAIQFNQDKELLLYPAYPQIKLWEDSVKKIEPNQEINYQLIGSKRRKYAVPKREQFQTEPKKVRAIFVLNAVPEEEIIIQKLKGMQKIRVLKKEAYRGRYVKGINKEINRFQLTSKIANDVDVFLVTRPRVGFKLTELADLIEAELQK